MALLYDYNKKVNPYENLLASPTNQTGGLISQPAQAKEQTAKTTSLSASPTATPVQAPVKQTTLTSAPKVTETIDTAMAKATAEKTTPTATPVEKSKTGFYSSPTGTANIPIYDQSGGLKGYIESGSTGPTDTEGKPLYSTTKPVVAPTSLTSLPDEERALYEKQLADEIASYTKQSEEKIKRIEAEGKKTQTSATSLLAKYGALGKTLTGAPVETGLGAASAIKNKIDAAIAEENANLQDLISRAKTGSAEKVQKRIDALNKLQQENYDNALKLAKQDKERYQVSGTGIFDTQIGEWKVKPTEKEQETKIIGTEKTGYYEYDPATKKTTLLIPANKTADDLTVSEKIFLAEKGYTLGSDGKLVKITDTGAISNEAKDWASLISEGKAKITEVPASMRNQVATALNSLPAKPAYLASIEKKIEVLDALTKNKGIDTAVGAYGINRINFNPFSWSDKAQKNSLIADIDKLVGEKALQALIDAKSSGATFGALSDSELQLLKNSSAKFASWARDKDGDGKTDYYEIDEKTFKDEINRIKQEYQDILDKARQGQQGTTTKTINDYRNECPDATDDELRELMEEEQGFNQVGKPKVSTIPYLKNYGSITGEKGSPFWKWGLDVDLKKGDPVYSPVEGIVVQAGDNKDGFGKRVGIKTAKGNIVYLSHNDAVNVKVGDKISKNQEIAKGGNTGKVIAVGGGDGSHLDITVKKPDGTYYTPQEIKSILS